MKLQMLLMAIIMTVAATVSGAVYGAASDPVICHTPSIQLALKIDTNHIAFIENTTGVNPEGRNLASTTQIQQVRTRLTPSGFTKIVNHNNKRHTIHINDTQSFSQLSDYIVIRNMEGHEITYPLNCEIF